jgi:hypothetical protein
LLAGTPLMQSNRRAVTYRSLYWLVALAIAEGAFLRFRGTTTTRPGEETNQRSS